MTGGPSQMDLFDPKPLLNQLDGKPLPKSFGKIETPFVEEDPICLGSRREVGQVRPGRHGHVRPRPRACTSTPTRSP